MTPNRINDYAEGLAEDVRHWPDRAARDLYDLLGHGLSAQTAAERREARLGLLIDLVADVAADGGTEPPRRSDYDDARACRTADGEDWPSSTALSDAYLGWSRAVAAALEVFDGDGRGISTDKTHSTKHRQSYTRAEITKAIINCREAIGDWPSQWEMALWAQAQRRLARMSNRQTTVLLPGLKQIRKKFGTWDRALARAIDEYENGRTYRHKRAVQKRREMRKRGTR